jgi:tRNA(Ile)-lysidine synthase
MSYRTLLTEFDPSIPLIRPLLDLWREETVAYCAAKGLRPSTDSSNVSPEFLRNRLRHELIPALEIYNPRAREAIWRAARNLAADRALLAEHLAAEFELLTVGKTRNYVALNAPRLATLSSGMRLHVVRLAVEHLRPGQETTSAMLDPAARFLIDASSVRHDLGGGLMLLREGEILYASRGEDSLPRGAWPQMPPGADSIPVAIPGCLDLAEGWKFAVESSAPPKVGPTEIGVDDHGWKAWLDSESLPERLELRGRRRGDRFEPLGMRGHTQKVSDFFVNAKVPSRARGRWPLLCAGDVVVWIPGYRMAERFKIRPETRQAVCFSVSRTG